MTVYHFNRRWARRAAHCVDWIGTRLFRPRDHSTSSLVTHHSALIKRVALLRWEQLGDVVVTLPALAAARAAWPGTHVTLIVRPELVAWLQDAGVADAVIGLQPPWQAWRPGNWIRLLRLARRFDLAFDFLGDPRNILCARLLARHAVGYAVRGGGFLLSRVAAYRPDLPIAQQHLRLLEVAAPTPAHLPVSPRCRAAAAQLLPATVGDFVVLHPGAGQPSKAWPHWQALALHLGGGAACVLTGTRAEAPQTAALAAALRRNGHRVWDLAGRTGLPALVGILGRARWVLAPDTGVIHLARALGTPTLALFGPVNPEVWGYAEPRHRSLVAPQSCSFCAQRRCPRRQDPGRCLAAIPAPAVVNALRELV